MKLSLKRILKEHDEMQDLVDVVRSGLEDIDKLSQDLEDDFRLMGRHTPKILLKNIHRMAGELLDPYGSFVMGATAALQAKRIEKDRAMVRSIAL